MKVEEEIMNNSIENIKDLSNEELKNEILKLNNIQLKNIKESSLLNILVSFNAIRILEEEGLVNEKYQLESTRMVEIIEKLRDLLINENKSELEKLRQELFDYKSVVDGYLIELSYVGEMVDENGVRLLSEKDTSSYSSKKVELIINQINESLDKSKENYGKYSFIISEIVRQLPMRIVKANYEEIIRATLSRNMQTFSRTMVDINIDNYKKNFASYLRDGYGTKFDYYFMRIEKIKREDLSSKSLEELSKFVEEVMELTEDLTGLSDFLLSLGIICNLIYVLYTIDGEGELKLEVSFEDILEIWEKSQEEDLDRIKRNSNELAERLGKLDRDLQKTLREYEIYTRELVTREDFQHSELDDELLHTRSVLAFYNDIHFTDIEYLKTVDIEVAEASYVEYSVEALIEYINRATNGMGNMERKIRMRKLLSLIDLPFGNISEFGNYIRYALDNRIMDEKIINFKLNQISYFLEEISDK